MELFPLHARTLFNMSVSMSYSICRRVPVDGMVDKSSSVVLMLQSTIILIMQHYLQVFSTSFNLYDM